MYRLKRVQKIPANIDLVWDFISVPANLKVITPDYMSFDVLTPDLPSKMYEGLFIAYKVSPLLNIKMNWVTEITHIKEKEYFVDEQRMGPYKIWHHQHFLKVINGGVEMTDIVDYQPPFGIFGKIANYFFIQNQLNEIFDFRTQKIFELFGKYPDC